MAGRDRSVRLAAGFGGLVVVTWLLIVLGALVRAHAAGLACPDWPLCFGEFVPEMDLRVGFEWTHRVVAGSVSILFVVLALLALRQPAIGRSVRAHLLVASCLLALQVLLGALTVWQLLAAWTVTSHLVTGNAFATALLWTALRLREAAAPAPARPPVPRAARRAAGIAAALVVLELVIGGLVASRYAGLVCPEWPACSGGVWFPSWSGLVGLHLLHRCVAYGLLVALAALAVLARSAPGLRGPARLALALCVAQVAVGVANVLLALPVEVTGLHSALATALVLTVSLVVRATWRPGPPA
jgi:heme A synthase